MMKWPLEDKWPLRLSSWSKERIQRTLPELEVDAVVSQPPEEDPDVGLSPQIPRSDHKPSAQKHEARDPKS